MSYGVDLKSLLGIIFPGLLDQFSQNLHHWFTAKGEWTDKVRNVMGSKIKVIFGLPWNSCGQGIFRTTWLIFIRFCFYLPPGFHNIGCVEPWGSIFGWIFPHCPGGGILFDGVASTFPCFICVSALTDQLNSKISWVRFFLYLFFYEGLLSL